MEERERATLNTYVVRTHRPTLFKYQGLRIERKHVLARLMTMILGLTKRARRVGSGVAVPPAMTRRFPVRAGPTVG